MTTINAINGQWARLEITRNARADGNVKFRVSIEGSEELRQYLRQTVIVQNTAFFMNDLPMRQVQHRMDGFLTQQGGRLYFPVYKLFELIEAKGYQLRSSCSHGPASVEVYMWHKAAPATES